MSEHGVGASVLRKEDDRFLRGRGQYVADFRIPGAREVAFVRSTVAHGRIRNVHVPDEHRNAVFTAERSGRRQADPGGDRAERLQAFLRADPGDSTRCAMSASWSPSASPARARRRRISPPAVVVDYEELQPVVDMLAARRPDAPLVHEEWGDNVFIEFFQDGAIDRVAETAAIKVTREIRTARHCMFPMEGRGVVAYWDARLGFLTVVSATQMPHIGAARRRRVPGPQRRLHSRDLARCGRRLRLQGPALPRRGGAGLAGDARRTPGALARGLPRAPDARTPIAASTTIASPAMPTADGRLLALDCVANVDAGAYSVYPDLVGAGGRSGGEPAAGALRFQCVPLPLRRGRDQQVPDPAVSRRGADRRLPRDRSHHGRDRPRGRYRALRGAPAQPRAARADAVRERGRASSSTAATIRNACAAPWRPSACPPSARDSATASRTAG